MNGELDWGLSNKDVRFVNRIERRAMTKDNNNNGHDSSSAVSKDSSKISYLSADKNSKIDRRIDDSVTNRGSRERSGRFPVWFLATAYVLVGLSMLYTAWGLFNSLSR
jgi:hypothetical protein